MNGPTWIALTLATSITTAIATARASTGRTARTIATIGSAFVLLLALVTAFLGRVKEGIGALSLLDSHGPPLGLDSLSAPLFPFVAALTLAVVAAKPSRNVHPGRLARQLLTSAATLAVLAARRGDVLMLAWVGTIVPLAFELRGRSGQRTFLIQQALGIVLIVASLVAAPAGHRGSDLSEALLLLGVMVRGGMVPFHAWVPRLFEAAPLGSALLFVQTQLGSYVLARDTVAAPSPTLLTVFDALAVVTVLYGAGLALVQASARRGLGYFAISQSALVLVGFADGGRLGATGAVLVIVAAGLAQTGFGLALSATEARRGALRVDIHQGGHAATPALAGTLLVLGLAAVGLPGTLSFVAEDLVFNTTLVARPWVGVAMILATAMNGITVFRYAFRLFGGRHRDSGEGDLTLRERAVFAALGVVLFALGVFPQPLLRSARAAVEHLDLYGSSPGDSASVLPRTPSEDAHP